MDENKNFFQKVAEEPNILRRSVLLWTTDLGRAARIAMIVGLFLTMLWTYWKLEM